MMSTSHCRIDLYMIYLLLISTVKASLSLAVALSGNAINGVAPAAREGSDGPITCALTGVSCLREISWMGRAWNIV